MGSKLQQVYTGIQLQSVSRVNNYTLAYRFLNGNVHGCVFAKDRPVSLNWSDYNKASKTAIATLLEKGVKVEKIRVGNKMWSCNYTRL